MLTRLNHLKRKISEQKSNIVLVVLWTILSSVIIIKIYWITYTQTVRLSYFKLIYAVYEGPTPEILDLALVAVASFLAGFYFTDIKELLYGYFANSLLTFVLGVTYVSLYIWYNLGWGEILGAFAFDWEWAIFFASLTVFTIMFPWILGVGLLSSIIGIFVKTWIKTF